MAERAVVAIMGDVTREEAAAIAEALTGDLPRTDVGAPTIPPVTPLPEGAVGRTAPEPSPTRPSTRAADTPTVLRRLFPPRR